MIKSLHIKNFAIIDEVQLDFDNGLTIITGETGAGKSILLGALGLILGGRADAKQFYNQDEKCIIEAEFNIANYDLEDFFKTEDLDYESSLIIRREILSTGKSRAFINDTPVNLKTLQLLASQLIDVHQQFDTLSIQHESFQRSALDALAKQKPNIKHYEQVFKDFMLKTKELEALKISSENFASEREFQQFLLDELSVLQLKSGIQNELESELSILENAELIKKNMDVAYRQLSESERSVVQELRDVNYLLQAVIKYNTAIEALSDRLEQAQLEIEDIASTLESIGEKTEFDPEKTEHHQQKLDLIYKLLKKHKKHSADDLLDLIDELEQKISGEGNVDERIKKLEKEIVSLENELKTEGKQISKGRKEAATVMEKQVNEMLHALNMPNAMIKVSMEALTSPSLHGFENINFLFSANKGSAPAEIKSVASGGELSRLALSIQSLVASSIPLPTMVFDEIDSGVSGSVAQKVGKILSDLSNGHQVIVITHSPQIAAQADKHYLVYKSDAQKQTRTYVKEMNKDERIYHIATMLSSDPPTTAAMTNARELMEIS